MIEWSLKCKCTIEMKMQTTLLLILTMRSFVSSLTIGTREFVRVDKCDNNVRCPAGTVPHCLADENWDLGQICMQQRMIQAGMCPYYNTYQGNLDARQCMEVVPKACPETNFYSYEGKSYENCMYMDTKMDYKTSAKTSTTQAVTFGSTLASTVNSTQISANQAQRNPREHPEFDTAGFIVSALFTSLIVALLIIAIILYKTGKCHQIQTMPPFKYLGCFLYDENSSDTTQRKHQDLDEEAQNQPLLNPESKCNTEISKKDTKVTKLQKTSCPSENDINASLEDEKKSLIDLYEQPEGAADSKSTCSEQKHLSIKNYSGESKTVPDTVKTNVNANSSKIRDYSEHKDHEDREKISETSSVSECNDEDDNLLSPDVTQNVILAEGTPPIQSVVPESKTYEGTNETVDISSKISTTEGIENSETVSSQSEDGRMTLSASEGNSTKHPYLDSGKKDETEEEHQQDIKRENNTADTSDNSSWPLTSESAPVENGNNSSEGLPIPSWHSVSGADKNGTDEERKIEITDDSNGAGRSPNNGTYKKEELVDEGQDEDKESADLPEASSPIIRNDVMNIKDGVDSGEQTGNSKEVPTLLSDQGAQSTEDHKENNGTTAPPKTTPGTKSFSSLSKEGNDDTVAEKEIETSRDNHGVDRYTHDDETANAGEKVDKEKKEGAEETPTPSLDSDDIPKSSSTHIEYDLSDMKTGDDGGEQNSSFHNDSATSIQVESNNTTEQALTANDEKVQSTHDPETTGELDTKGKQGDATLSDINEPPDKIPKVRSFPSSSSSSPSQILSCPDRHRNEEIPIPEVSVRDRIKSYEN